MNAFAALLLALALVPLARLSWQRPRARSGRKYPRLLRAQWARFGLPAFFLLALDGRLGAVVAVPPEFDRVRAWMDVDALTPADRHVLALACAVGLAIGAVLMLLVTWWRARRGKAEGTMFGDARSVIPSDPRDYGWAAAVAVSAGVTEEAYFRLLLPLLATAAFGHAPAAFAGAALLFGAAHRYQGWRGMIATGVAGVAMTLLYLAAASLPLAMALHAAADLVHLVARPALRRWVEGKQR